MLAPAGKSTQISSRRNGPGLENRLNHRNCCAFCDSDAEDALGGVVVEDELNGIGRQRRIGQFDGLGGVEDPLELVRRGRRRENPRDRKQRDGQQPPEEVDRSELDLAAERVVNLVCIAYSPCTADQAEVSPDSNPSAKIWFPLSK